MFRLVSILAAVGCGSSPPSGSEEPRPYVSGNAEAPSAPRSEDDRLRQSALRDGTISLWQAASEIGELSVKPLASGQVATMLEDVRFQGVPADYDVTLVAAFGPRESAGFANAEEVASADGSIVMRRGTANYQRRILTHDDGPIIMLVTATSLQCQSLALRIGGQSTEEPIWQRESNVVSTRVTAEELVQLSDAEDAAVVVCGQILPLTVRQRDRIRRFARIMVSDYITTVDWDALVRDWEADDVGTEPPTGDTEDTPVVDTERACCKVCGARSKPCGDSCISLEKTCHKPSGCACDG